MENKELETWLEETKAKNLSLDELRIIIRTDLKKELAIKIRNKFNLVAGESLSECLFNQWQQETEFSPKRGDRVLVWNDGKSFEFERIFLTKIEGTEEPIYVVAKQSETSFIGGGMFYIETYEHMKPLPTEQPTETEFKSKVIELIEKRIDVLSNLIPTNIQFELYATAHKNKESKEELSELLNQIKQLC
jgi:hypothetical protein